MSGSVLLVGCGNMGFALLRGWRAANPDLEILVAEVDEALRARAEGEGARCARHVEALYPEQPDLIILAVKPQVIGQLAAACAPFAAKGAAIVSVAAGVATADIATALPEGSEVIRCMPNTPAAIGAGAMALYTGPETRPMTRDRITSLFGASGAVVWLDDEALMDAVTAISGSGPAYVFHFIEALEAAGVALGLPADAARRLAIQTVAGAGRMASELEISPATLREQVTSPGGTTAVALAVLQGDDRLIELVRDAAFAAWQRGRELGTNAEAAYAARASMGGQ